MIRRAITIATATQPVTTLPPERVKALRKNFSPLAARRLTTLPLLLGEVCRDAHPAPDDEWVFASQFGGSVSLERYLGSFPNPSPLHFQNSIQPGPIDLVNVAQRQPAALLTPIIAGRDVVAEGLLTAMISPAPVVHLTGGEEAEPWTADRALGSPLSYAFYLKLETSADAALGEISFHPGETTDSGLFAEDFPGVLQRREAITIGLPERGTLRIRWA
ncbi:MAG: hypothetical protein ACQKBV_02115 [Puniceicoccales bacterium]